jgi:hypothetical protein
MAEPRFYRYARIEAKGLIRLLKLHPYRAGYPLTASIQTYALDTDVEYDCLSYTWGTLATDHFIQIEDGDAPNSTDSISTPSSRPLRITEHLDLALRSIRSLDSPRWLWVDAICINQRDLDERSQQIPYMKHLFAHAHQVIVFLGGEADGSDRVPEICRIIYQAKERWSEIHGIGNEDPFSIDITLAEYQALGLPPSNDNFWAALEAFLGRPWFTRAWIIQEVVHARKIFFICGRWGLEGNELIYPLAITFDHRLLRKGPNQSKEPAYAQGARQLAFMILLGLGSIADLEIHNLLNLLQGSRYTRSTDPRDRVYAFLGLSKEPEELELQPDYNEALRDTYVRYARYFVSRGLGPDLLYNVHVGNKEVDLPSWVPNWSDNSIPIVRLAPQKRINEVKWALRDPPYNSAGGLDTDMRLGTNPDALIAKGIFFDVIDQVGIQHHKSNPYDVVDKCIKEMRELLGDLEYPTGESQKNVVWRTAIWNRQFRLQLEAPVSYATKFEPLIYRLMWGKNDASVRKDIIQQLMARIFIQIEENVDFDTIICPKIDAVIQEAFADAKLFADQAAECCTQMRRCITKRGYLSHVPLSSQVGDVICVIFGSAIPFVIRAEGQESWRLIGESYCHGIMKGEALAMKDLSKAEICIV